MTFLSKLALPALAVLLAAPAAMHAQSSGSSNSGSTNAGSTASQTGSSATAPKPTKKSHHKTKSPGNTMDTTSKPMPDASAQPAENPSIAKPGTDPVNPNNSPEPPVPTTQGPPPAGTTPTTNQVAPHL